MSTPPAASEALAVTTFGPTSDGPAVLAVHGITANGRSWNTVAAHLGALRIIAPDLRGRGRSNRMPGPYGLRRHAADLAALLDADGGGARTVLGHSMGAFVTVALAAARPDLVERLVLVDGGFPLALPATAVGIDDLDVAALLGPAAQRLSMDFADDDAYLDFWRAHPAFRDDWSTAVEDYARYDLDGEPPHRRASTVVAAMLEDGAELYGPAWYVEALRALRMPVTVLRAPRGLTDADPLYAAGALDAFRDLVPQLEVIEVDDVNHYTILFAHRGAARVAAAASASSAAPASEPTTKESP
ncbi:alpha/beta fold hydrolase [Microbacterium oxydans]|uniref:Tropinesterase n=1 Tax=Microbacterium oxydans TaxID=82380 RepID=A0A0F0LQM2_9MICO|nr:alpha/beta hydrolase [Microbacterium oxydans]KJL33821.1 Tropinesterase [Microbacterium oxydans]